MRASERRDLLAGRKCLLAIGQQLRAEYPAVEEPVPERLAALLHKVEMPATVVVRRQRAADRMRERRVPAGHR